MKTFPCREIVCDSFLPCLPTRVAIIHYRSHGNTGVLRRTRLSFAGPVNKNSSFNCWAVLFPNAKLIQAVFRAIPRRAWTCRHLRLAHKRGRDLWPLLEYIRGRTVRYCKGWQNDPRFLVVNISHETNLCINLAIRLVCVAAAGRNGTVFCTWQLLWQRQTWL